MRSIRAAAALLCVLLCVLSFSTSGAAAQERKAPDALTASPAAGREHFQLKVGAGYDQGDFGTMVALRGPDIVRVPLADAVRELKTVDRRIYDAASVFFG